MTDKKASRFLAIDSNVAFKLQLDPDIYNASLASVLGVGNTLLANQKTVSTTLKGAVKDGHATLLRATVAKGNKDSDETRVIELLCDKDNADTARTDLIDKVVQLGRGNVTSPWIITKVK